MNGEQISGDFLAQLVVYSSLMAKWKSGYTQVVSKMKPLSLVVLILIFAINGARSDSHGCIRTCDTPLKSLQFKGTTPDQDYWVGECTNFLRVQSLFLCMRQHCTDDAIGAGLKELAHECEHDGHTALLPWSIIDNITSEEEARLKQINYDDLTQDGKPEVEAQEGVVVVSNTLFALSMRTTNTRDESARTRAIYAYALFGFWGIVLLIGFSNRLYVILHHQIRRKAGIKYSSHSKPTSSVTLVKLWIRGYLTTPSLISHHTAQPIGWCTIPPRLQSITLVMFLVINVVLSCVSYDLFTGNLYWASTRTQLWRYLADRMGCLALANMPLIWAFAVRNNVLIWLTGWSFTTFNQFHRWVARIATVEAIIHGVGYTVETFLSGGREAYFAEWAKRFWWMGAIAAIIMCFICGLSIYPMRAFYYEAFLILHIAFATLFLIAVYYHVEIFEGEYNPYIWPCVALWVLDRLLRIFWVALVNLPSCRGTAIYSADADVIRVNVPVRARIDPKPGTYYFIYFLNGLKFWESHPFTLSSWTSASNGNAGSLPNACSFVVRPHDGFTRRLRDHVLRDRHGENNNQTLGTPVRVVIEGPYGIPHDLRHHDSALLVVGGSGITVALAHVQLLCDALNKNEPLRIRNVHLVWAVREDALFQDVLEHEISSSWLGESRVAAEVEVQIDLYVTGRSGSSSSGCLTSPASFDKSQPTSSARVAGTDDLKTQSLSSLYPNINIFNHRPDIGDIIAVNAQARATGGKKMAIVCCGPPQMADDARAGVVAALASGCDGMDFIPESFNW